MAQDVVIDTNALYVWSGHATGRKLSQADMDRIATRDSIVVSSLTLFEAVRYHASRGDLAMLKKCIEPILQNRASVFQVGVAPVDMAALTKISVAPDLVSCQDEINALVSAKIAAEAQMLTYLSLASVAGLLSVLLAHVSRGATTAQIAGFELHAKALLAGNHEFFAGLIAHELTVGYQAGDEKKAIKRALTAVLRCTFEVMILNIHAVKNGKSIEECASDHALQDRVRKDADGDPVLLEMRSKYADNPTGLLADKQHKAEVDKFLAGLKADAGTDVRFTAPIIEAIVIRLRKLFREKTKLEKNDAIDTLQLYSLQSPGSSTNRVILTLDKDLQKILEVVDPPSHDYMKANGALIT